MREKVVAASSARLVILVGPEKLVARLGERGRLPVEVIPFAVPLCSVKLRELCGEPVLRTDDAGEVEYGAPPVVERARAVGVPQNKIRIRGAMLGGGFGGKEDITVEIVLALLAKHTGRPVRLAYTREESLAAHSKRHPFTITHRTGVQRNGRITNSALANKIDMSPPPTLERVNQEWGDPWGLNAHTLVRPA